MNDVVAMVERYRRNNLTANFSVTNDQCNRNLHPTENAFFRRGKGLQKNYDLTEIGIGLKQRWDYGIEGKFCPGWRD